jgi:hypothetical protein
MVNGQDKRFKCLWTGVLVSVPGRRTGLCRELQCWWVFHTQQFPVCIKNNPPPKGHPANLTQQWEALESTWASIPVEHLVESMPRPIEAVLKAKGGATQYYEGVPNVLYTHSTFKISDNLSNSSVQNRLKTGQFQNRCISVSTSP